jgi:hypothetical protein
MTLNPMTLKTVQRVAVTGTLGALVATMAMAVPAQAQSAKAVVKHGTCSNGATWKLKAKHDDALIQWEFEVDTKHAGRVWTVRVGDNGTRVFHGKATTVAPSDSFSIERKTANRAGADVIRAHATRGSATCTASLTV